MPRGYGLSETVKGAIWKLRAEGLSDREIGRQLGLGRGSVSNHLTRWQDANGHGWCSDRLSPHAKGALSEPLSYRALEAITTPPAAVNRSA